MRDYVEQRRFGSIVRLELERGMPQCLQDFLVKHLGTRPYQVFKSRMPLAFSEFMGLGGIDRPALKYPPFHPTLPEALEPETDTFAAIRKRDLMFYHPYETFGGVLNFLQKAATDPNVVAIKQTLYRCGSDSPVVRSLLEARRLGKQVTAVVELKARFDEEQNINWAEELEAAGVNVVYGFARPQDPRQALPRRAPRTRGPAPLRARGHRQLQRRAPPRSTPTSASSRPTTQSATTSRTSST